MMPPMTASLARKRVTVMGLGRFGGGVGVARWLAGQGARVLVTDLDAQVLSLKTPLSHSLPLSLDLFANLALGQTLRREP